MKPKLVIFEGPDKVGKTTLFREFRAATHYIPLAIDRFTGSNFVYDQYYNRDTMLTEYLEAESKIQEIFDCYLVLLIGNKDELKKRIILGEIENHAREVALSNFLPVMELFKDYYVKYTRYEKTLVLNTSILDIDTTLEKILEFTGEANRNAR